MEEYGSRYPRHGDLIRLSPFAEVAQIFLCEPLGDKIRLGIIFQSSRRAETFFLSREEFAQRVTIIPSLPQQFAHGHLMPQKAFTLYAEALRMRLAYTFDPHYAVSVTQVDLLPHQVDAVYQHILPLPKVRFLLADDPGLGKTIMAGLLLRELKARGAIRRILIIVPAHLQDQWRREMRDWFREDFTLLDRGLAEQLRSDDFLERNPQIITSLDFAKREPYPQLFSRKRWDLVIFDEAHKLSAAKYGREEKRTQRYELGQALAQATNHLLLLTATPHKGDHFAYFKLIELLEPYLFAHELHLLEISRAQGLPFVLRRSKEQVTDIEGRKLFKRRDVSSVKVQLSPAEHELYKAVTAYVQKWYGRVAGARDRRSRNISLALVVLQRRLASSLMAIRESLRRRKAKLLTLLDRWEAARDEGYDLPPGGEVEEAEDYTDQERTRLEERREGLTSAETPEELRDEIEQLERLIQLARSAEQAGQEAKIEQLRGLVETHLKNKSDEKLLVFTEFKDTLQGLIKRFREWGYETATIHGEMTLDERIEQERRFRDENHIQVMVATDAAGEGLNLQFCRLMVNYDLPWNPNRLEQRMGRIHRYGQKRDCYIYNMLYAETREGQILNTLLEKLNEMRTQLGDSVYDVVGTLLEGVRLEELVMQAVLKDSTQEIEVRIMRNAEEAFQQYRKALEESALAGHHIDHTAISKDDARSREMRLVPWDVERFTKEAVALIGGTVQIDKKISGIWKIAVPREFAKRFQLPDSCVRGLRISFERRIIKEAEIPPELLAPGHPLFEALCDHFLQGKERPLRTLLVDAKGRSGALWLYRARVLDGENRPAREQLLAFFYDQTSQEAHEVDPRVLWEFEGAEPTSQVPAPFIESLTQAEQAVRTAVARQVDHVFEEARTRRERDTSIKGEYLEKSFGTLLAESNRKLLDYQRRLDAGEEMRLAIEEEDQHLKELVREQDERRRALEREMSLTRLEPELIAVALIVPKSALAEQVAAMPADEELKRRVERAAMEVAMSYERDQGRTPQDVSSEYRGYDILSQGPAETRYIEVKGFQTTGQLELTAHEWQMAHRLRDRYWVYAVEQALTNPELTRIQDPAEKLPSPHEIHGPVTFVFADWKRSGQ